MGGLNGQSYRVAPSLVAVNLSIVVAAGVGGYGAFLSLGSRITADFYRMPLRVIDIQVLVTF